MTKIEKVIKGLECRLECGCMNEDQCNPDCPYLGDPRACSGLDEDVVTLLKAQEPVEPTWRRGLAFCSSCGRQFCHGFKYCPDCGKPVKWA